MSWPIIWVTNKLKKPYLVMFELFFLWLTFELKNVRKEDLKFL